MALNINCLTNYQLSLTPQLFTHKPKVGSISNPKWHTNVKISKRFCKLQWSHLHWQIFFWHTNCIPSGFQQQFIHVFNYIFKLTFQCFLDVPDLKYDGWVFPTKFYGRPTFKQKMINCSKLDKYSFLLPYKSLNNYIQNLSMCKLIVSPFITWTLTIKVEIKEPTLTPRLVNLILCLFIYALANYQAEEQRVFPCFLSLSKSHKACGIHYLSPLMSI